MHDFKGFQLVSISVSFCDLGVECNTEDLVKFLRGRLFQDIFKMAGHQLRKTFVHSLFCGAGRILTTYVYSQRQSWALVSIRLKLPEAWKHLTLLCGFRLFMFCWTDLEQMLKKNRQNIRQNEHWVLETSCKLGLQPEGAHNRHSETVIN